MASFTKGSIRRSWKRNWQNYHLLYFSLIEEFHPIPFESLLKGDGDFIMRLKEAGIHRYNFDYWNHKDTLLAMTQQKDTFMMRSQEFLEIQKEIIELGTKKPDFLIGKSKQNKVV